METLKSLINAFFQFKAYVMLPIIILVLSLIIGMKIGKALMVALRIAAGFAGIFIAFDFFVQNINPAIQSLIFVRGLDFPILDVGWPPLAAITWASPIAHITIPMIIVINLIMLSLNLTKTIYIDIWNYWHFAMLGALILGTSQSLALGLVATAMIGIYTIKMSDWAGPVVHRETGISGLTISPLSSVGLLPYADGIDWLLDKIPGIRSIRFNPHLKGDKQMVLGEPMFIGTMVGLLLGWLAAYPLKSTLELSIHIAAVMFILPKCGALIGEGMGEVSLTLRTSIQKRFPKKIGLQVALKAEILMEHKSVLTTGIILMPISLFIALVLPGNKTLPLGDLPALIPQVGIIVLVCRGNVFRSVIAGIPLVIAYLLIATNLAPLITRLAEQVGAPGPEGVLITALTDGGNPIRYWGYMLFQGNIVAFSIIPVVLVLMVLSRKRYLAGLNQEFTESL
ncbi:MAG: PTS galactitol transporter subunit IIC [Spirochaetes bacterium GWC2_52_13]|nr:MAG: PTS galactitol transporter subunit IIC [Spirochaetes bacterium GWC2_52_13]HCG63999.1 PTS galactitol transporter subunit IIC [Sphaerochaeta sp.]